MLLSLLANGLDVNDPLELRMTPDRELPTPRTDAAVDRMDRNHTPSWPKVVEADFAREMEREIVAIGLRQAQELDGVASLIADFESFLGALPSDLGSEHLAGQRAQLRGRILQVASR